MLLDFRAVGTGAGCVTDSTLQQCAYTNRGSSAATTLICWQETFQVLTSFLVRGLWEAFRDWGKALRPLSAFTETVQKTSTARIRIWFHCNARQAGSEALSQGGVAASCVFRCFWSWRSVLLCWVKPECVQQCRRNYFDNVFALCPCWMPVCPA